MEIIQSLVVHHPIAGVGVFFGEIKFPPQRLGTHVDVDVDIDVAMRRFATFAGRAIRQVWCVGWSPGNTVLLFLHT